MPSRPNVNERRNSKNSIHIPGGIVEAFHADLSAVQADEAAIQITASKLPPGVRNCFASAAVLVNPARDAAV